jgi:hypothetical protein
VLTLGLVSLVVTTAPAQTTAEQPGAARGASPEPATESYWLRVTGDRVNLRSRADVNSRLVGRVSQDDVLEAVGQEYGWHRVIPPEGVFSIVAARYIERVGDRRGVVRVNTTLRVRVGSDIQRRDPLLSEVQTRLPPDAEVEIVGELDPHWLKIVPPKGVHVYISGDFVEQVSAEVAKRLRAARRSSTPPVSTASRPSRPTVAGATTRPARPPELTGPWGRRLKPILTRIELEGRKPAGEQSWDLILDRLEPIAAQREEPQVARLAAEWTREVRQHAQDQAALRAGQEVARRSEEGRARQARELQEIRRAADQLKAPSPFDARGVLRPSFVLPAGPYGMRYKLQDPFTHKVRAYVELPTELDIDVQTCLGKYVGIRGERKPVEGVSVPLFRVTKMTVLNPDGPSQPPAREQP